MRSSRTKYSPVILNLNADHPSSLRKLHKKVLPESSRNRNSDEFYKARRIRMSVVRTAWNFGKLFLP